MAAAHDIETAPYAAAELPRIGTNAKALPYRSPAISGVRQNDKNANAINVIPSVQSCQKKYSAFGVGQIIFTSSPRPAPTEGRFAIVTNVGRDAVDADGALDEWRLRRTAKACGPDAPTLASSF